jgi:hypothetical protein
MSTVYSVTFPDNPNTGATPVVGTQVGDVVLRVVGTGALSEIGPAPSVFEAVISVAGQIQQNLTTGFPSATWKAVIARG